MGPKDSNNLYYDLSEKVGTLELPQAVILRAKSLSQQQQAHTPATAI